MRNQKLFGDETGKRWPFLPSFCEIMQVFYASDDNDARLFFCFSQKKTLMMRMCLVGLWTNFDASLIRIMVAYPTLVGVVCSRLAARWGE